MMSDKKTRKLMCNVSGKPLFASKDYFAKKVEVAGSEDNLYKTYICKEVKTLAKKGYTISDIRESVEIYNNYKCTLSDNQLKEITGSNTSLRINNCEQPTIGVIKTDPAVRKFLTKILKK